MDRICELLVTTKEGQLLVGIVRLVDDESVDLTSLNDNLKNWFQEWAAAPLFAGLITGSNP
jgi:hypothetical protein